MGRRKRSRKRDEQENDKNFKGKKREKMRRRKRYRKHEEQENHKNL